MKRSVIFIIFILALALLPVAAQAQSEAEIGQSEGRAKVTQQGDLTVVRSADHINLWLAPGGEQYRLLSTISKATGGQCAGDSVLSEAGWCGLCGCGDWKCEVELLHKCAEIVCPLGDACCGDWDSNANCWFGDPCFNDGTCECLVRVWCC